MHIKNHAPLRGVAGFPTSASEHRQPCIYIAFGSGSAIYLIEPLGYTKSAVNHCSLATKPVWNWSKVNRSIHFPVLVFLVLVGLLLLLTGSAIFSRASRPKSGFEKAINDAPVETAGLVRQDFVGTFPEPVKGKISVNYQEGHSFIGARLNKVAARLSGVPSHLKNHVHPRGSRLRANLWTRIHARTLGFFERWLAHEPKAAHKRLTLR